MAPLIVLTIRCRVLKKKPGRAELKCDRAEVIAEPLMRKGTASSDASQSSTNENTNKRRDFFPIRGSDIPSHLTRVLLRL